MALYSLTDIKRSLPAAYVERGAEYQRARRVFDVSVANSGAKISGRVQGTESEPYAVVAYVKSRPHAPPAILGNCTCPVGSNCKHVAAVLIEALQRPSRAEAPVQPARADDPLVRDWLDAVERAAAPEEAAPTAGSERLLYLLTLDARPPNPRVHVAFAQVRRLKDGGYGQPTRFSGDPFSQARFVTEADRRILRKFYVTRGATTLDAVLAAADGAELLRDMLATGRCHWHDKDAPALALGEARRATIDWALNEDGTQRPVCRGDGVDVVLPLQPPWYLDATRTRCGPLDVGLPPALAHALLSAPALNPEQAAIARTRLAQQLKSNEVALPRALESVSGDRIAPVPHLHLLVAPVALGGGMRRQFGAERVPIPAARLSFDYAGLHVEAGDRRPLLTRVVDGKAVSIARDRAAEHAARAALDDWGFVELGQAAGVRAAPEHAGDLVVLDDEAETLLDFGLYGVPELRAQGWIITTADDYPFRIVDGDVAWYAQIDEGARNDWFDVDVGVALGGERVNLVPVLLELVRHVPGILDRAGLEQHKDQTITVPLPDGRVLPVKFERLYPILDTLAELFGDAPPEKAARVARARAAPLADLERALGDKLEWCGGERLRALGQRLRDFTGIQAVAPPAGLQAELRDYQKHGLNWLQFLREYELGGVLADDMGLGKTIQTLAHLLAEKDSGRADRPSLVVAPTSLMVNWRMEAERFAPSLRVLVSHGLSRKQQFDTIARHDVVLTTYPLLPRDFDALNQHEYHLLILDEAQVIKNPKARHSQLVRQLRARHRLCLTGTPMENHLGELWSLFDFLMPGLLGDEREFRRLYRTPIEKHGDVERRARLTRRVAPFMLRRTKSEVVKELPPKTEMLRAVEIDGAQRDLYESIRVAMHDKVRREIERKGMARSQIVILDALLKLRQVCCDPRLLPLESGKRVGESAKLDALMQMLPELIEEGRRVLLFSQFTGMLALIEEELKKIKLDYVKLTGDTQDRAKPVKRFQNGEVPLFLISLKAGGTGLNLTAADTVIHYDPWWNPAVERQATDRAHRIGQDKPVFVYKLITTGTVEEKILHLQTRKQELADSLFEEKGKSGPQLTPADLHALFEPL
jgi:superfamily II DNA or RNA helicase